MTEVGTSTEQVEVEADFSVDVKKPSFLAGFMEKQRADKAAERGDELSPAERYEVTMEALKDHFGDRILHYGSYSGTVVDIVNLCPAAGYYFDKGPDAFIAWIEAEETEPAIDAGVSTQDDKQEDTPRNETEATAVSQPEKEPASVDSVGEASVDTAKEASSTEAPSEPPTNEQSSSDAKDEPKRPSLDTNTTEKPSHDARKIADAKKLSTKEAVVSQPIALAIEQSELALPFASKPESEPEPESEAQPQLDADTVAPSLDLDVPAQVDAAEIVPTRQTDAVVQAESETLEPELFEISAIEPEALIIDDSSESVPPEVLVLPEHQEEVAASEVELPLEYTPLEQSSINETHFDVIDEVLQNESPEQAEESAVSRQFEVWRELSKEEPLLDETFITMSEQLDTAMFVDEAAEDVFEIDGVSEAMPIEVSFVEFQEAELHQDVAAKELFDQELTQKASPELVTLFVAIKASKKSVEKLYQARSKEECAQYLNEIVAELTQILRALGYTHPEQYVRDFLSGHSIEALRSLINELEKSLRHAMYREVRSKQKYQATHRQTRLGKFVGYILQAVTATLSPSKTSN